jgi:energy-coupling factor transporter ATP-binding protein EcfA2
VKLAYVDLCGFRGYRKPLRIDFPDGFTIIDGRNGVGKSTIFDAVEFALTGTIAKYGDAKADGETVADYIWWSGAGAPPPERYVEIGFRDGDGMLTVRRTQLDDVDPLALSAAQNSLCDARTAPKSPLPQLCAASIIRDEHIAALSLDLKEAERYSLLSNAIGATDADIWTERGSKLLNLVQKRAKAADREVEIAAKDLAALARRIDETRAALLEEALIEEAATRLQSYTKSTAPPDKLAEPARAAIAESARQIEKFASLEAAWRETDLARSRLPNLRQSVSTAQEAKTRADAAYIAIAVKSQPTASSDLLAQQARDLTTLVMLGRRLGLRDGHCPLCASDRTDSGFLEGLALAEHYAKQLDAQAVNQAEREQASQAAATAAATAREELEKLEFLLRSTQATVDEFERRITATGLPIDISVDELRKRQQMLRVGLDEARKDLRILETLKLNAGLEKAIHEEAETREVYARAEARLGVARRAESRAQALYDAARRAGGETLNRRLERVLPLMAELYRRLRPHPVWSDIEYKIRGDVKRFLKLQVGDELNPQFIFSSGQRRATGLAFLLSVNLSLAWSHWQTILLDDPVQHVDDFRSIHLAEVMAQLSAAGKQIICAVEDAALADLLCRRLPIENVGAGKRVTLGPDSEGALTKLNEQDLAPLVQRALVTEPHR